ncbi:MAG TPA: 50S ribosomal protein L25 [Candidatus Marinimicrobia bacterium]|jgi:large subunit ribosomal protein L25|nr:50S ribosomal protein L25 [Candidatus Neomarinimicrobiota bacterium]
MSKFEKLNVKIRDGKGSSSARRTRLKDQIPAVLYHSGLDAISLSVDKKELYKALKTGQVIFEVTVKDENQFVLVKDVQYHPVYDNIMHIDFQKVKEDEKISLEVPLKVTGEAEGVQAGGILVQIVNAITVKCKPTTIPDALIIDVTDLELNSSLFVKDIQLAADVEIITAEDLAVVSVQEPKKEEEIVEEIVEEMLEGEEGIEAEGEESAGGKDDSSETKKEEDSDGKEQKSKEEK